MTKLDFIDKPINPETPRLFTVISTFAGCGGSSLGYKWAGGKVLMAVEWEQNAVDTYRLNHKGTCVLHRDIATVTAEELLELCDLNPGKLDIFDGSPPCQGFSTAGKRDMSDSRNQLFREYVRLLKDLQPRCFIMENVSGMVKGKMKPIFAEILTELKACGYVVKAWLLNAKYFGVPQSRERMIFIGVREDLGIVPTCPKAFSYQITAEKALEKIINNQEERQFLLDAAQKYIAYKEWPNIPIGGKKTDIAPVGGGFSCTKFHPNRPARTIQKNDGNLTMYGALHWSEWRRFTTAEFQRFASFPDTFEWVYKKTWGDGVNRIGNSVPPRFMQAIAEHVYQTILKPSQQS